jgi:rare lipoprotein A (peptidoglycan hydrolase)
LSKRKLVLFLMTLPGITTLAISQQVPIRWESAGKASSYGWERQGKRTSSGEVFDYHKLTAAHRTLPFGSIVLVTNTRNGKQVKVRINDRGPGYPRRIIDVSTAAARRLGFDGLTDATIAVLYYGPVTPDYCYLALHCQAGQGGKKPCGFYFTRDFDRQGLGEEPDRQQQSHQNRSLARGPLEESLVRVGGPR